MKKCIFLFLLLIANLSFAYPKILQSTSYYEIKANNVEELRHALAKAGIERNSAKEFSAYTTWTVNWKYGYQHVNKECYLKNIQVILTVHYLMPKLINVDSTSVEFQKQWHQYITALRAHERGHKDIGLDAALDIEKMIQQNLSGNNCTNLNNRINKLGNKILAQYRAIEINYDKKTKHGETQGVIL